MFTLYRMSGLSSTVPWMILPRSPPFCRGKRRTTRLRIQWPIRQAVATIAGGTFSYRLIHNMVSMNPPMHIATSARSPFC